MKTNKKTTLSCEQVYEIWKNEPELISIVDVRSASDFLHMHIPNSLHLDTEKLVDHLGSIGNRLAVIVADETKKPLIEELLKSFDNYVLVRDFNRWSELAQNASTLKPMMVNNVPEVTCENTFENGKSARLIDVRRPDEYNGELGHVKNAELITLGEDLTKFLEMADKNQTIIFICRSGMRSGKATEESKMLGFKNTYNMTGGMIRWNECKLPVDKN